MREKSQNADSGKEIKNKKEKTIQQQKGLPTLSADLNCGLSVPDLDMSVWFSHDDLGPPEGSIAKTPSPPIPHLFFIQVICPRHLVLVFDS